MMELLKYIFSNFDTFVMTLLLICVPIWAVGEAISKIILACKGIEKND